MLTVAGAILILIVCVVFQFIDQHTQMFDNDLENVCPCYLGQEASSKLGHVAKAPLGWDIYEST